MKYTYNHKLLQPARIKTGQAASETAHRVRKTRNTLRRWELGKICPTPQGLGDLAEALDVSVADFFDAS